MMERLGWAGPLGGPATGFSPFLLNRLGRFF
jgi:hypothetical protein